MQFVETLFEAPLANVLIGAGVLVLLAGVLGTLPGLERIDERGRRAAWVVGPALILTGLLLVSGVVTNETTPAEGTGDTNGLAVPTTPSDTRPTAAPGASAPTTGSTSLVQEIEPNDAAQRATLLPPGATGAGTIARPPGGYETADTDQFRFWAVAGEAVTVEVSRDGGYGTLFAVVYDPNGGSHPSRSLQNDVAPVGGGGPLTVEFIPQTTGYHHVVVTGSFDFGDIDYQRFDGGYGDYTVRVEGGTEQSRR
ncbi:PPC domain-containing protein [Halomarina oriensis]|uniref:Uncharacterized protein n=1 Tax=Halomarina oriensis TaxID=671145 RepID=A0A6B0GNN4_9EURY|nr:PPC domain-containing protein [Halomarina oriensis]MWG35197.1 hypothetical protein [Halomarina oriensis]